MDINAQSSSPVDRAHLISMNEDGHCPSSTLGRLQQTGQHLTDSLRAKMVNPANTFLANYAKSNSQLLLTNEDSAIWGDVALEVRPSTADDNDDFEATAAATAADRHVVLNVERNGAKKRAALTMRRRCRVAGQWLFDRLKSKLSTCPCSTTVRTFAFAICLLITVHGALSTGYTMSVITTIEKRFQITSTTSGMIVSSYEIGSLLSVIFVSYFGSSGDIPRWIGCGGIVLALGSFLFSLPHYIATPYSYFANKSIDAIIWLRPASQDRLLAQEPHICEERHQLNNSIFAYANGNDNAIGESSNGGYVLVLMLAQVLLGVGGSPLFTLGTTYLDDRLDKESSSVYLAIMYAMLAFGPVCGFLLGGLMLSEYVDPNATPPDVSADSAGWVGLWWGGFIVCGFFYLICSLPFFCFPRQRVSCAATTSADVVDTNANANCSSSTACEASPTSVTTGSGTTYGKDIRKIPVSIFRLISNSVYMVTSLNACIDLAIVSGFVVFLPKYLETQFLMSKSDASIFTGSVAVPGACIGTLFGGWVLKRLKMVMGHVANYVVLVNCVAVLLLTGLFFFGCDNLKVAGVNQPYDDGHRSTLQFYDKRSDHQQLPWNHCNVNCDCSLRHMQPICGTDGVTYLSPCFAGCRNFNVGSEGKRPSIVGDVDKFYRNYTNCSCISANGSAAAQAVDGPCLSKCNMLIPFMVMLFLITLVASNNQMPLVMITLRAVSEEEKAFALGLQVVFLRLLSYLPAPILFGAIIDTTCRLMDDSWGSVEGASCLFYDTETFRYRFALLCLTFKIAGFAVSCLMRWCMRRRYAPFSAPVTMSEIVHRLGDIENLHLQRCNAKGSMRHWVSDDSLFSRPRSPRHRKTMSS